MVWCRFVGCWEFRCAEAEAERNAAARSVEQAESAVQWARAEADKLVALMHEGEQRSREQEANARKQQKVIC